MQTVFAGVVSKKDMDPKDAAVLTEDCRMYNAMLPGAMQILQKHSPESEDSVFMEIRGRYPDAKYEAKGYVPAVRDGGDRLVASNPMTQCFISDAEALAKSTSACLDLNIQTKQDHVSQMETKRSSLLKELARYQAMEASLIDRSKALTEFWAAQMAEMDAAASEGRMPKKVRVKIPAFQNKDKKAITVTKGSDNTLSFEVDLGWKNRSRKKAPRKPVIYESEYLFETQFLKPRIKSLKQQIAAITCRINNAKQEIGGLKQIKKQDRPHICLGRRGRFHKQFNTPTAQAKRKKCEGGRGKHPRDWRKGRDRKVSDKSQKKGPWPSVRKQVEKEKRARTYVPDEADDQAYHLAWRGEYAKARVRRMLLVGNKHAPCGNDLVRFNVRDNTMYYRSMNGSWIRIPDVQFSYGKDLINAAVTADCYKDLDKEKTRRHYDPTYFTSTLVPVPVTWSIKDLGNAFQITCTLDVPQGKMIIQDKPDAGYIGIDMNWDRIAINEAGAKGELLLPPLFSVDTAGHTVFPDRLSKADCEHLQLVDVKNSDKKVIGRRLKRVLRLRMEHRTSEQIDSDISAALEHVFAWAKMQGKPVAIENIEKIDLKTLYQNHKRNRRVCLFAFSKITKMAKKKALKYGIALHQVNPAYTSQIAKFKYMQLFGLSIHECAAYVIARRAMGLNEPVPDGTGDGPGDMTHLIPEKIREKHEWSQWAYLMRSFKDIPVWYFYNKIPYNDCADVSEVKAFLKDKAEKNIKQDKNV